MAGTSLIGGLISSSSLPQPITKAAAIANIMFLIILQQMKNTPLYTIANRQVFQLKNHVHCPEYMPA